MRPADYVRIALLNLWKRKVRTTFTVLAIVIGALLISLMVSLGEGGTDFLTGQLTAMTPPEAVMISPFPGTEAEYLGQTFGQTINLGGPPAEIAEGEESVSEKLRSFTKEELDKIRAIPEVERIDPRVMVDAESARLEGTARRYRVMAIAMPPYVARRLKLAAGRYLQDTDTGTAIIANQYLQVWGFSEPQEVLGQQIVLTVKESPLLRLLAPSSVKGAEPGAKELKAKEYRFTVVGVTEKTIMSSIVVIPVEDAKEMARFSLRTDTLYTEQHPGVAAQVKVSDKRYVGQVAATVREMGLEARTSDDVLGTIGSISGILETILSLFGLIALAVASLGIVNTLITAIYERTREIGLMKALGASEGTIRALFVTEAASIGLFGGMLGVALGWLLGQLANEVAKNTFLKEFQMFQVSIFPWWLAPSVIGLSTVSAVLAGLYPANRAARLDPIEALRYE